MMKSEEEIIYMIPALRAYARTFHRNPNDADDLVQETLLKGIANIEKYTPGTRMKSWLFTIMRNTYINRARITTREGPALVDDIGSRLSVQADQDNLLERAEIIQAIRKLPLQQMEVLVLVAVLGMSYMETAEICGCREGTVKSRLFRARKTLSEMMGYSEAVAD